MPTYNRAVSADSRKTDKFLNSNNREEPPAVADQGNSSRAGKRKTKHGAAKQLLNLDNAGDSTPPEQMDQQPSASPTKSQSILGQLNQGFPQSMNHGNSDILSDLNGNQKVSDEYTPPSNIWARNTSYMYGQSPPVETLRGLGPAASPPCEPGFSARGTLNTRSPAVSPPSRKARPVSYGSGMPPLPAHPRISTSPYGYGVSAYGSPPALPHLPQQHFYGPHDVDLGLASAATHMNLSQPHTFKFVRIPGFGHEPRGAVLLTCEGVLNVLSYNGERLEHVGALMGVQGIVVDAAFLTWNADEDPFADLRPLIAVAIHGPGSAEAPPSVPRDLHSQEYQEPTLETKVVVYSLRKTCQVAELLRVPCVQPSFPGNVPTSASTGDLKVRASAGFVVISSGESGEVFIFSARKGKDSPGFECLGKYWTTLQPQLQRRESSHGPSSDADVSPADLGRASANESTPILSMNGRWLAFCPTSSPSRRSIGAILGNSVVYNKNSNITAGTAPTRPPVNCEVESPDAESFFGKVAKGFAQEAVRSAKWISEKSLQTWQSYWKRDSTSPPVLPAAVSSSPPIYSPHLGLAQFPPTHGIDPQDVSRAPEVVTILDLKLLQEGSGRKGVESNPAITFQPPGGCSFLSFMPTGLGLLTANRKGDVQYVWDLMQIKYIRSSATTTGTESGRVRQIARYERLSPSTIVDVVWDGPTGYRFALLTKNRTVHIFDLPKTAFQWPPPRAKEDRPISAPADQTHAKMEHEAPSSGFFASAMSIAGRTQPMLANLRGRAPSMNGGITGIGASGIGLASATGIKSGKAVAAGLSKSLGAATETVTNLRHANQSRLSLKTVARAGVICWLERDGKSVLSVLDSSSVKNYYIRMTKPRENRHRDTMSVFDARRAVAFKLPKATDLIAGSAADLPSSLPPGDGNELSGFWRFRAGRDGATKTPHPLAFAEIETNPPYQPFHSDRRVIMSLVGEESSSSGDNILGPSRLFPQRNFPSGRPTTAASEDKWVFGTEIRSQKLNIVGPSQQVGDEGSVIYRETKMTPSVATLNAATGEVLDDGVSHVVSSTKKRKSKKGRPPPQIFEDEDASGIGLDFAKPDDTGDPDFDLLDSDTRI
ncbi:hypothetical protein A1O1_04089 [Capronia coronata CBS 617.96]|uniref:BCAS3 domain-containing protein n=1 Tax=Capronia coronata CBS 617.96 TaxID=1182541 RepID=W9YDN0_9EURO|nr:uncharacterized protein A1O1_04089 [Capronia coronata CBS 617.96]EXJ90982.1 hypothetical protein A1O1_04089 [Capronia coronata CBS 617.96]